MSTRLCARFSRRHLPCLDKSSARHHVLLRREHASIAQTAELNISKHGPQMRTGLHEVRSPKPANDFKNDQKTALKRARSEAAVSIEIDGTVHKFAPVLLRDLCSCPLCVDQSTRQKLFVTADIPLSIQANDCVADSESAVISWKSDAPGYGSEHKSEIPISTLRNIILYGKPSGHPVADQDLPKRVFWTADMYSRRCPDIDYDSYMQDDGTLLAALKQLHTHGLVFITSVPEDEKSVETLAERIGPLKTTFYGRTWDVRSVPQAKNVAYTSQNLGFHMDLLYMEQPPHLQLLHCIRSSSAGGASLFTDSFLAVEDLHKSQRAQYETLMQTKASFHYNHPESHYYHQLRSVIEQKPRQMGNFPDYPFKKFMTQDARQLAENSHPIDLVSAVAWSPPFQAPFALDRDVVVDTDSNGTVSHNPDAQRWNEELSNNVQDWHKAAQTFNDLIHREENIYERLMKPGECVIFDNRRVLHARKAFEVGDAGKERWLRGAYIDKDPYLSKLRTVLARDRKMEALMIDGIVDDAKHRRIGGASAGMW